MSRDANHAEMSWSLANNADQKAEYLSSLLKYIINNGSSMQPDEIILSIHVIGTSLDKLSSNDVLFARGAYLVLIKHFTKHLSEGHINTIHLMDVKEILAINGPLLFSFLPVEKLISALIPSKLLNPFQDAVTRRSFSTCSKIDRSDMSILQNGITNVDKFLCIDFGMVTETVMEYISGISNALILMISSLACNCTAEEMQTNTGNACYVTVINVHKRVTELAIGTLYAKNHLTNSTEVLVFCINELLRNCKMDLAYLYANRFLNMLPTALSFLPFVSSTLYDALWDDPVAGVGDWLENILRAVPVLMDQQEDAMNLQKATLSTISFSTKLVDVAFMGNTSNIWTNSSFNCYRDLCAASSGDHGYCGTEDVNALLILLLEHSLDKGYLDENDKEQLVNTMLYFPKGSESEVITSDPFCLKIVAVCVLGRQNAAQIVYYILRSIDIESRNGTPEHSTFWLLECVSELLDSEDLKKSASYAVDILYDALKSDNKRQRVHYALEAVHLLLVGGQSHGNRQVMLEKFRKCCCDFFDLSKTPKWENALLTRSVLNFNHWNELHDLYINWLYDMQWDEEHLPAHIILPPTVSFLSKIVDGIAILPAERCHFIRIRPLLLDSVYAAYLNKFNGEVVTVNEAYMLKIETFVAVGLPIVDDCSLIDLVNLPLIYYDSLLLFYNQSRKYCCSTEELMRIAEFVSGMYKNAINAICERSKIMLSLGAYTASLSLAKSDVLNSAVPHARGELHSILNDDLLKLVRAWAGLMVPELRFSCTPVMLDAISDTFQSPYSIVAQAQDITKQKFAAFCSLCDNTARFVLNQLLSRNSVEHQDETRSFLDWMIFIHSSDLTGTATRELNQSMMTKMNVILVMSRHLAHIVSTLLDGILAQQTTSETNLLNGQSIFCSILIHLVSSQNSLNLPWDTLPEDIFSSVLDHLAEDDSLMKRSVPFVNLLSTICCLKNAHLNSRFLSSLEKHQDLLVQWVSVSAAPLETFCMLQPLIEHLAGDRDGKTSFIDPDFRALLEKMINVLFDEKVHQRTADSSLIEVKRSDRWAYASLCWRKMSNENEKEGTESEDRRHTQLKELDVFSKALLTLLNIGGPKIHCHLVKQCAKLFRELVDMIRKDGLELLKGSPSVSSSQVTAVLYAVIFLCSILDYIDGLCRVLCPPGVVRDDSDDISTVFMPKHIIKKKLTSSRSRTLPLCTFASTAKQFVQQHWYNCYTCGMIEGEGQIWIIFCDCGAKGCVALKSASYPKPQRIINQKYAALPSSRSKSSKRRLSVFSQLSVMDEDKEEIGNHLCQFMETLTNDRENIISLITAVKKGVCLRSIKAREIRIREMDAKLMQGLIISTDRIIMEPLISYSKALFDKQIEAGKNVENMMASLEIGDTILLVAVQESSKIVLLGIRSLLSASTKDCDIPRVELDAVGFKIVALASMKDLLAVCGLNHCLILRINKDGDISERQSVEFANSFPSYAVPKVRWVTYDSSNMIAVAALQFIRIYDLNTANVPSTFEFVLPMGDVTELAFGKRNDGLIIIIVLSSAGHLYIEEVEKARRADGASYFMTTTLQLPTTSNAISMHYSTEIRFLFVSMENKTYVLHFNGTEFEEAKSLPFDFPLTNWCECAGVFAALSHPSCTSAVFLYPYGNTVYTQTKTLTDPVTAQCMLLGSDYVSQLLIQILANQNLQLFRSSWLMEPDFWVKDVERSMLETEIRPFTVVEDDIPEPDMVTVFEQCRPIQKLEFYSKTLEHIYDTVELTKRITSSGMSVVCLKQKEFEIVVKNLDWNCIICALRIEVTPDKCPTSVTVFGEKINLQTKTSRIFDIRLSRKQSINCNNEVMLNFTCNNIPAQIWSIKRMDWLIPLALRFTAPDFEHVTVSHRALILLRQLSSTTSSFFEQKYDGVISNPLPLFCIPGHDFIFIADKPSKHWNLAAVTFQRFCCSAESDSFASDFAADAVLEVLLISAFMYLAVNSENSAEITRLILEILFSDNIVIAHRCKCLMSAIVSNYCVASVQNHSNLFTFIGALTPPTLTDKNTISAEGLHMGVGTQSAHGGFRPAIIHELENQINKERGIPVPFKSSSDLEDFNRKIYVPIYPEMAWIGQLLLAFVSRLDICNCDGIDYLINGLDFSKVQIERTVKAERDQVILRLIYVILVQCTSHNWSSSNSRKLIEERLHHVAISKSEELTAILSAANVTAVAAAGSVDDGDDVEAGGESDLEQMEGTELAGDISSSSRDATPQQDDTDVTTINVISQAESTTHEDGSIIPEPQIDLAVKVAHILVSSGALNYCYVLLQSLKTEYIKQTQSSEQDIQKLSSIPPELQPDLAPLFNSRVLNINPGNVFSIYTTLLVEIALRLPYQLKKILGDELLLNNRWENLLCDYITQEPSTMRRLARKLLLLMCGSDTMKYRQVRDEHIIHDLLANLKKRLKGRSSLEYFELSDIVGRLNGVAVVSERRCIVWQKICLKELPWLMELACMMPDVACDAVLNLILLAIRTSENSDDELLCCSLVNILFLLGENEERRWTLHAILRATLQLASRPNQLQLINHLYRHTWPHAQEMGNRAAQLVDLLSCYLPRFLSKDELITVYKEAVSTINSALYTLEKSRSSVLFEKLCEFIGSPDISVLNKSPCLICSDLDHPMEQLKLSSIKLDSRFTTSAQMIKLMGHFEVSRIIIRLSEIKRSKMVKRFKFYYCNKILESAVDLKNRPELWEKAADVKINQGDTEIDVQLPIPVVTCNVILEMAEFYDTNTAGAADAPEFVHCPRCSTSVAPNPGICSNCGENVFQCVKCRAINYDEKEPFLCNSCGFCKYARLEAVLVGRSLPSVQAVEDDNDRKMTCVLMETLLNDIESTRCHIGIINALMERCSWDSEPAIRPNMILKHMTLQSFTHFISSLNLKEDFTLATLYHSAEKLHNKLCEQTRQLEAFRAELLRYDIENGDETLLNKPITNNFHSNFDHCVGCVSALIVHCVALIQATCSDTNAMEEIIREDFVFGKLVSGCALGDPIARSIHSLIWNLSEVSKEATQKMCDLVLGAEIALLDAHGCDWEWQYRDGFACIGLVFKNLLTTSNKSKKTSTVDSSNFSADKMRNAGTLAGYPLPTHEEQQSKTALDASRNIDSEDNDNENEEEEVEQNLVLDDTVLHKIMDDMKILDEEEPDFDRLLIPSERFPTTGWLQGRFIWAEYRELLQKDGPEKERGILQYIKRCSESDPKRKFSLYQWLTRCMFSSVAAVRTATCRLLVMLCFEINNDGEAQIGSPVDIALVLQKVLLWMRKIRHVSADNIDEYFCLIRTLLTIDDIHSVLVSKPVEFHVDVVKRILLASLDIRLREVSRPLGDLSTGILLHHLIQVLNCMMPMNKQGWNLLYESSPVILPFLLRAASALKQVTIHRTYYVNESIKELSVLLMRIALKRPILVLKETTRRIGAHSQEPRIQAYLLSIISDIIYPLLKKEEDFLIQIEKDALQEDYLQGRMLGNPYKSSDAGMGPLMRDIKNKICRDCELVALLDDDTGMELLVNQQIIALDLPVNDVYEKLWRSDHHGQPMVIVYRMRGLLGDATEPFIKTLADTSVKEKVDDSQLRLATALGSPIRAFATILPILDNIELTGGGIILLRELHRLLTYCIKVTFLSQITQDWWKMTNRKKIVLGQGNREQMNEYGGIRRFLHVFEVAYRSGIKEKPIEAIALQYLELSRILLVDVLATDRIEKSIGGASFEQMSWLLELSMGIDEELSASLLEAVTSIAPNLCLGNAESMDALVETFRPCCHWDEIDNDRTIRDRVIQKVETLCKITSAIHDSASGRILKKMMDAGLIADACRYLAENHPPIFNVSPSLKYVLKLMAGMARAHKPSQEAIAENSLPILHRLEQISSAEHIGTLAENTKTAFENGYGNRQKGQVKVSARKLANEPHSLESVSDFSICCICREAMDASAKIMMVYAFASRLNLKANKVINGRNHSFTTVSQMNLVHLDCHSIAVRMAGSRSEWASAALHNANTKCNVIIPIWSKRVKDSDMEHSFQRLSTDLEVAVDCDTVNLDSLTLDIAELLDRFVKFRSFSALSHGGGRESNMQYMAVLILLVQYLKKVSPSSEPGEAHSFIHQISINLVMDTAEHWNSKRLNLLKNLQESKRSWKDARHELLVWATVDYYQNKILQCRVSDCTQYMRENIIKIMENCSKFVTYFDSELSQCRNYDELMKAVDIDVGNVIFE
ncbi:hypothetical protein DINM_001193 [Dirofilaria immitis]|nr:hypothetical protein [Dirofilaria immitis]